MAATDSDTSLLAARAREIGELEQSAYRDRTPRSQAATDRARRARLPPALVDNSLALGIVDDAEPA